MPDKNETPPSQCEALIKRQHGLNLGLSTSERGRTGVSVGYQEMSGNKVQGFGFKVGYSCDKNGGMSVNATYAQNTSIGDMSASMTGDSIMITRMDLG